MFDIGTDNFLRGCTDNKFFIKRVGFGVGNNLPARRKNNLAADKKFNRNDAFQFDICPARVFYGQ